MEAQVLVLSYAYTPINFVSWQKAIGWIFSGRAVIEDVYEGRYINSPSQAYPLPSIVRFVRKAKKFFYHNGIKFNRKNIWLRDAGICQYCGKKVPMNGFTFDHVIPRVAGGKTSWENIVVACTKCNQKKEGRTPEQAHMKLMNKPYAPKTLPGAFTPGFMWKVGMPESWKDYMKSIQYWTDEIQ